MDINVLQIVIVKAILNAVLIDVVQSVVSAKYPRVWGKGQGNLGEVVYREGEIHSRYEGT